MPRCSVHSSCLEVRGSNSGTEIDVLTSCDFPLLLEEDAGHVSQNRSRLLIFEFIIHH